MSKRNRLCTLAMAGALTVLGGSLVPDARAMTGDVDRAGGINVYVQNLKITEVTGEFSFDLRVVLWSSNDWDYQLRAAEGVNVMGTAGGGDGEDGKVTTYHEKVYPNFATGTLKDPLAPGQFDIEVLFKGKPGSKTFGVPSVPEVIQTLTLTPGAYVENGGSWSQDFSVEFKVDSNKTTLTSDILGSDIRVAGDATGVMPGMPAGDTYFFMNFQASGTYPLEPDPDLGHSVLLGVWVDMDPGDPAPQIMPGLAGRIAHSWQ